VLLSSPWICPITMREMNGATKFVYNRPCGCVLSELAMREMGESAKNACPVCNKPLAGAPRTLNPVDEEREIVALEWEAQKEREREEKLAKKGEKKRKKDKDRSPTDTGSATPTTGTGTEGERSTKKARPEIERAAIKKPPPKFTAPAPQPKPVSVAVASLYLPKDAKPLRATAGSEWMVSGTFHRHA
jgi:hypothetical protein